MSEEQKPGSKSLPIGGILVKPGSSTEYKTGDWRAFRPYVDEKKCTGCLICWIYCPDSAISRKPPVVTINYEFCKGCGICSTECPVKAITMVEEGA